jgi:hypothetical protein
MRCGKTRLLEVLELLVCRPWRGTAPSEAAVFRFLDSRRPTLLLDEQESLSRRNVSERDSAILAILNAGYKQGQTVPRCVGGENELQFFKVYGPKAFAAIGDLPSALRDRCITIPMQRRAPGEAVARFRYEAAKREAEPVRVNVQRAAVALSAPVKAAYANLGELCFLSDRDEELFSPLFSLCACLAPGRISELKVQAQRLCRTKADDTLEDSEALRLLADIQAIWPEGAEAMFTESLIQGLQGLPDSLWAAGLSPRGLANKLRGFDVRPRLVRIGSGLSRGYIREELERAFARYLGQPPLETDSLPL